MLLRQILLRKELYRYEELKPLYFSCFFVSFSYKLFTAESKLKNHKIRFLPETAINALVRHWQRLLPRLSSSFLSSQVFQRFNLSVKTAIRERRPFRRQPRGSPAFEEPSLVAFSIDSASPAAVRTV